ncbi:MAG: NADH-quinone oxidoreductase subunit J [bacterium]
MITFLFFLFASIAIASAIMMLVHRNPIYCALFLIVTLFALAGLYVLLNAPFIAAVHVIVYTGAIMVLFLFVIMLLNLKSDIAKERPSWLLQMLGIIVAGIFFIELAFFVHSGSNSASAAASFIKSGNQLGSTKAIGNLLFTEYLLPFEIASVLLLAAIIGSVILAKRKLKE